MRYNLTPVAVMVAMAFFPSLALSGLFEITPAMQAGLDRKKTVIAEWAANPVVVKAVLEQNAKGPIDGMNNAKWKTIRRSDALVAGLQENAAAIVLKQKLDDGHGLFSEAFVNAALGEKVAFAEKTSNYIHKGSPKFDVPFNTGKSWQGTPEFDESSQIYAVQISVPVVAAGKNVGVLVVGVRLSRLGKVQD